MLLSRSHWFCWLVEANVEQMRSDFPSAKINDHGVKINANQVEYGYIEMDTRINERRQPVNVHQMIWVCFISVETVPKVDANDRYFFKKTFGTFYLSTHLKCTQMIFLVKVNTTVMFFTATMPFALKGDAEQLMLDIIDSIYLLDGPSTSIG